MRHATRRLHATTFLQIVPCRTFSANVPRVPLWIDGKDVQSTTDKWIELLNPATNELIAWVPEASHTRIILQAACINVSRSVGNYRRERSSSCKRITRVPEVEGSSRTGTWYFRIRFAETLHTVHL
jgi:hypothetical protein